MAWLHDKSSSGRLCKSQSLLAGTGRMPIIERASVKVLKTTKIYQEYACTFWVSVLAALVLGSCLGTLLLFIALHFVF
jgi:hypothetical protein